MGGGSPLVHYVIDVEQSLSCTRVAAPMSQTPILYMEPTMGDIQMPIR